MNPLRLIVILISFSLVFLLSPSVEGKKIRQSLKVDSKTANKKITKEKNGDEGNEKKIWINGNDTLFLSRDKVEYIIPDSIKFTGYDKNAGSSKETFHVVNGSHHHLTGLIIEITYKDMKGRMLHSRKQTLKCDIPQEETRKIDISSWDIQNSFYYYLSNEPKRVASPYQVEIKLLALTIKN